MRKWERENNGRGWLDGRMVGCDGKSKKSLEEIPGQTLAQGLRHTRVHLSCISMIFQLFLLLYISMSFAQTFVVLSFFALEKLPLWLLLKILRLFYSYFWGFLKFVTLNSLTKACSLQHKQEHFFLLTDALSNVIDPKNFCF